MHDDEAHRKEEAWSLVQSGMIVLLPIDHSELSCLSTLVFQGMPLWLWRLRTMKAVEFETTVNNEGQISLPTDLAGNIPSGEPVRVVVMWDPSPADEVWREAGRRKFEEAYCTADAVYEQLANNDAPSR